MYRGEFPTEGQKEHWHCHAQHLRDTPGQASMSYLHSCGVELGLVCENQIFGEFKLQNFTNYDQTCPLFSMT